MTYFMNVENRLVLISVRGCVNLRTILRLERLRKLKKLNYLIVT
jgi:hypothetical protein